MDKKELEYIRFLLKQNILFKPHQEKNVIAKLRKNDMTDILTQITKLWVKATKSNNSIYINNEYPQSLQSLPIKEIDTTPLRDEIKKYKDKSQKLKEQLKSIKDENKIIEKDYKDTIKELKDEIKELKDKNKEFKNTNSKREKELTKKYEDEIKELKDKYEDEIKELKDNNISKQKLESEIALKNKYYNKVGELECKVNKLKEKINELENPKEEVKVDMDELFDEFSSDEESTDEEYYKKPNIKIMEEEIEDEEEYEMKKLSDEEIKKYMGDIDYLGKSKSNILL